MTHAKASEVAASWGVLNRGYEKGSVFYTLTGKADQVCSEDHRKELLSYTEDCLVEAQRQLDVEVAKGAIGERVGAREALEDLHTLKSYFTHTPPADASRSFVSGYIEAALFTSTDDNEDPLDDQYSLADIDETVLAEITIGCEQFQTENAKLLAEVYELDTPGCGSEAYAGHNFWLTRNGHGTGFWDRGYPKPLADALTKASTKFGEVNLTVDEGTFYYG